MLKCNIPTLKVVGDKIVADREVFRALGSQFALASHENGAVVILLDGSRRGLGLIELIQQVTQVERGVRCGIERQKFGFGGGFRHQLLLGGFCEDGGPAEAAKVTAMATTVIVTGVAGVGRRSEAETVWAE
jgi:hypothetical protein